MPKFWADCSYTFLLCLCEQLRLWWNCADEQTRKSRKSHVTAPMKNFNLSVLLECFIKPFEYYWILPSSLVQWALEGSLYLSRGHRLEFPNKDELQSLNNPMNADSVQQFFSPITMITVVMLSHCYWACSSSSPVLNRWVFTFFCQ